MSHEDRKYVTWSIFIWVAAVVMGVLGWFATSIASQSGKIETLRDKQSMTESSVTAIQTDLEWIKRTLTDIKESIKSKK